MAVLLFIIYMLVLIIFGLVVFAVMQIKMAGLTVKDFWSFIEANQELDKLDKIAKKYEKMSTPQQTNKYQNVLEAYKDIKVMRWIENDKSNVKEEVTDTK